MAEPLLAIEDLRTYFYTDGGVARAVDGVSLHRRAGRDLGLVGESGCGKSVTALSHHAPRRAARAASSRAAASVRRRATCWRSTSATCAASAATASP